MPFATAQITAVVAQSALESLGLGGDRFKHLGIAGRFLQIMEAVARAPQGDVVLNTGVEHEHLLWHIGQAAAHHGIAMLLPRSAIE